MDPAHGESAGQLTSSTRSPGRIRVLLHVLLLLVGTHSAWLPAAVVGTWTWTWTWIWPLARGSPLRLGLPERGRQFDGRLDGSGPRPGWRAVLQQSPSIGSVGSNDALQQHGGRACPQEVDENIQSSKLTQMDQRVGNAPVPLIHLGPFLLGF